MAGSVHIPWYATGLRADKLEQALNEFSPVALRHGATSYTVFRYRDDRYKFLQVLAFEDKKQFELFWYGPEFSRFRALNSSYYQVPLLYQWADSTASGELGYDPAEAGKTTGENPETAGTNELGEPVPAAGDAQAG